MFLTKKISNSGFVTLLFVLILGAIGLAVGTSLVLLGLSFSRNSLTLNQSHQAVVLADGCAERGLERIRDENSYSGTASFSLDQGSCSYTVTNLGGSSRQLDAVGTVGTVIRKNRIQINQISPVIQVSSWKEIP